jgi:O-antigen/teichoic acid export membrane protein
MLLEIAGRARQYIAAPRPGLDILARIRNLIRKDPSIVIMSMAALNVLRLISSLILTRLLAPSDFGIVGIVGTIQYTLIMLFDIGFDALVIQHPDVEDRRFFNVVWTVRFAQSIMLALIMAISANAVALFFGNQSLSNVLVVSALGFAANAPQSLSLIFAIRNKQIVLLSVLDVCLAFAGLIITIGVAFLLRNFWALVVSGIFVGLFRSLISYLLFSSPFYRFSLDKEILARIWHFSRFILGSSLITLVIGQIDKFVLGRSMTIEEFGIYMIASGLAYVPQAFCDTYGSRVLFPTYSQAFRNDPNSVRDIFHAKLKRLGPFYCFAVGGLIGFAPVLIALMYQDRYADVAYFLAVLSIPSFFALSSKAANEALVAIGHVRTTYYANLIRLGWLVPAISLAVYLERTDAILAAIAARELPATIYVWWMLRKQGVLSLRLELSTVLVGACGIAVGWGSYKIIGIFLHIVPAGLFG